MNVGFEEKFQSEAECFVRREKKKKKLVRNVTVAFFEHPGGDATATLAVSREKEERRTEIVFRPRWSNVVTSADSVVRETRRSTELCNFSVKRAR